MRLLDQVPRRAGVLFAPRLCRPMQRVEHALFADVPEAAVAVARDAVPEDHVIALHFANLFLYVLIEVEADDASQIESFVRRKARSPECVPGQHEPLGQSVQVMLAFDGGQLLHAPLLHLAARGVERVLGPDGIGIELLEQVSSACLRAAAARFRA